MFMTSEQAKRTWCPHARVVALNTGAAPFGGYNRAFDAKEDTKILNPACTGCVADQCAAWRWEKPIQELDMVSGDVDKRGYCGLAGRPCT